MPRYRENAERNSQTPTAEKVESWPKKCHRKLGTPALNQSGLEPRIYWFALQREDAKHTFMRPA